MFIKLTEYWTDTQFYLDSERVLRLEEVPADISLTKIIIPDNNIIVIGHFDFIARLLNGQEPEKTTMEKFAEALVMTDET